MCTVHRLPPGRRKWGKAGGEKRGEKNSSEKTNKIERTKKINACAQTRGNVWQRHTTGIPGGGGESHDKVTKFGQKQSVYFLKFQNLGQN